MARGRPPSRDGRTPPNPSRRKAPMTLQLWAQAVGGDDASTKFAVPLLIFGGVVILFAFVLFVLFAKYFNLWIQAKTTQANIGLLDLIGMTFRKVNPNIIVRSKIMAIQAGLTEKD